MSGSFAGLNLSQNAEVTNFAGNQVTVLPPGVKDRNLWLQILLCQTLLLRNALHQELLGGL